MLTSRFAQLEAALPADQPWFSGARFGQVDAAFAPVFRYFDAFEAAGETGWFDASPRVRGWRARLARRPSVQAAVLPDFPRRLDAFLRARGGALSRRMGA